MGRIPRWLPESASFSSYFPLRQNDQGGRICYFKEGECLKSSGHSEGQVRLETEQN